MKYGISGETVFVLCFEDSWREPTDSACLGTFHLGTSLSNPPFEAEVTRVTKKAWSMYFESSYRGKGKEKGLKQRKRERNSRRNCFRRRTRGRACQPLSMWQIFDVEIIADEGSAQSGGTTYDCDELLSNTPTYSLTLSLKQCFQYLIQSRPNLKAVLLGFYAIHTHHLKQSLVKQKVLKHAGLNPARCTTSWGFCLIFLF